jgi:hypothetical protein
MVQQFSQDLAGIVTPSQVILCPYYEEEPAVWFHLIGAQFAATGIRAQKIKYANALANLPKKVFRDILDTVDTCSESDHPFDDFKAVLLWQFGKSKWQSYFELLHLPLGMNDIKPSIVMGKLKQLLPHGVSPDDDLFFSMFVIRLPPRW